MQNVSQLFECSGPFAVVFRHMHPPPCIGGVEHVVILHHFTFAQPEQRFQGFAGCTCFFPEIKWNKMRHVASKSINIEFAHPVLHSSDHCCAHFAATEVEIDHIMPAILLCKVSC